MKIAIVDGNYQVIRCSAVAVNEDLRDSQNRPVGGLYIFSKILSNIFEEYDKVICIFDGGLNQKRLDIYPEYKLREEKEEQSEYDIKFKEILDFSFPACEKLLDLSGIVNFRIKGHEADDIIYFLSIYLSKENKVTVVTDDRDYLQLVNKGVSVYRPMAKEFVSLMNFRDIISINPELFIYYKAIIGDSSDNINGIKGIGDKTAQKILNYVEENDYLSNPIKGIESWSNSGETKRHISLRENFNIIERNLNLVDISTMSEFSDLYIEKYNECLNNLKEIDLLKLKKYLQSFDFNLDTIYKYVSLLVK